MPSPLVHRYAVYAHLGEEGKVNRILSRATNLFMAVEGCLSAYQTTGHTGYLIEDQIRERTFVLERTTLLRLAFVRANDQGRYFELLNRLDRSGDQKSMESFLSENAPL